MEEHLLAKVKQGAVTYTSINTGMFLDWALARGLIVHLTPLGDLQRSTMAAQLRSRSALLT